MGEAGIIIASEQINNKHTNTVEYVNPEIKHTLNKQDLASGRQINSQMQLGEKIQELIRYDNNCNYLLL